MKILAVYNLKGGVGKTSTAVNIAYLASQAGFKTLLWDLDPQGASSWYFEAEHSGRIKGRKILKQELPLCKLIQKTSYSNLSIIPADISFGQFDAQLEKMDKNLRLSKILAPFQDNYSLLILDCPPGLTRLTENMFYAMDAVLLPMIPTWLSLRSYDQLRLFLNEKKLSHKQIYPFFSMVDYRKKLHQEWLKIPPAQIKRLLQSYISYSSIVERMGEHKLPVELFADHTAVAASYRSLWKEIKLKLKLKAVLF
ncbi:MAG: AAA family ATPase [Pseudomonadota bacterium]